MKTINIETIPRHPEREYNLKCFLCPETATVRRSMGHGAATVNICLCPECNRLDDDGLELALNRRQIARTTGRSVCCYCGADLGPCNIPMGQVSHGCCGECYQKQLKEMEG